MIGDGGTAHGSTAVPGAWDPGLQVERTGLAWQRTLLSGLACSLAVARLLAFVSGTAALVTGVLAVLGTAALGLLARDRLRRNDAAVRLQRPLTDGRAPLMLTLLVVLTAVSAAFFVLLEP